jgi:nucleoside-diphosphate-sugar epimerase
VNGLLERGYEVAILHTGRHEIDEIPQVVEHIHTDPFAEDALREAVRGRRWDLTIATYGRLRTVAKVFGGQTARFISVGGGPAYRGYMNATALEPEGMLVPTAEDDAKVRGEADDAKGYRVLLSEEVVFEHHPNATHLRYPYIYGRYQIAPREWLVVKRILDRRPHIIVADGGLTLNHFGGAENMAHAVLLAADNPAACGRIYNCGDEKVLTVRQLIDVCAGALGHDWDVVSMPSELALPARPLTMQPWTTHRVFDLTKIKAELGYADVVDPLAGLAASARWYAEHPLPNGGLAERSLQDPFDYAAEDALVRAWRDALNRIGQTGDEFASMPGYGASYSGPGGTPRRTKFEK